MIGLPLTGSQKVDLIGALHRFARQPLPHPDRVAEMVDRGPISAFGDLPVEVRAPLRAALLHSAALERALSTITNHPPARSAAPLPHPLGEDARFPPRVARLLGTEGAIVRGHPRPLPGFPFSTTILGFREAVRREPPSAAVVIGAGYVGAEISLAWARAGTRVTLVDRRRAVLRGFVPQTAAVVRQHLLDAGVQIELRVHASGWEPAGEHIAFRGEQDARPFTRTVDVIVVAAGLQRQRSR